MNTNASTRTIVPVSSSFDSSSANVTPRQVEFYRIPKVGGDPYFGLSRSHYYELERAGKLKLVRLRREGATRGIVLIPYAAVKAIVEAAAEAGQ